MNKEQYIIEKMKQEIAELKTSLYEAEFLIIALKEQVEQITQIENNEKESEE